MRFKTEQTCIVSSLNKSLLSVKESTFSSKKLLLKENLKEVTGAMKREILDLTDCSGSNN
jgi:hypothetical protein